MATSTKHLQYQIDIAKRNLLCWLAEMERCGADHTEAVKKEADKLARLFLEQKGVPHV